MVIKSFLEIFFALGPKMHASSIRRQISVCFMGRGDLAGWYELKYDANTTSTGFHVRKVMLHDVCNLYDCVVSFMLVRITEIKGFNSNLRIYLKKMVQSIASVAHKYKYFTFTAISLLLTTIAS